MANALSKAAKSMQQRKSSHFDSVAGAGRYSSAIERASKRMQDEGAPARKAKADADFDAEQARVLREMQSYGHTLNPLERAVEKYTQGTDEQQVYNSLKDTLGSMFAGGFTGSAISAARNNSLKGVAKLFGPQGMFSPNVPMSQVNTFAGAGANTANAEAFALAKTMKAAGHTDESILQATAKLGQPIHTGFPDGMSRFEIDDSAANLLTPEKGKFSSQWVSANVDHPAGFEAYPDLQTIGFTKSGSGGSYQRQINRLDDGLPNIDENINVASGGKSTTLHELQHAIQQREGFAKGGSPEGMHRDWVNAQNELETLQDAQNLMTDAEELGGLTAGNIDEVLKMWGKVGLEPKDGAAFMAKANDPKDVAEHLARAQKAFDSIGGYNARPAEQYKRLAGEAEARLVQKRMNLTADERYAEPIKYGSKYGFDVPEADQIVRRDGGIAEMNVWHGSPHRFNNADEANPMGKFDISKVGTGEGAQAYGHGIYNAERKDVAQGYQRDLSDAAERPASQQAEAFYNALNPMASGAVFHKGRMYAKDDFISAFENGKMDAFDFSPAQRTAVEKEFSGYLYESDLPDEDIAKMLDWDAPLSEQPQAVRDAVQSVVRLTQAELDTMPVKMIYEMIGSPQEASAALNKAGIPGIKYLDRGSRASGEGTRNFVSFDPTRAKILSRNGETAPVNNALSSGVAQPSSRFSFGFDSRDAIQSEADKLAARLNANGFQATVDHSGSKLGASSYVTVYDPQTKRFIKDPARFSGHSKGPFNNQMVHNMLGQDDADNFFDLAIEMRNKGPIAEQPLSEQALRRIAKSERKKLKQSAPLPMDEASRNGERAAPTNALAMDKASRMGRAAEQEFDKSVYHATDEEFDAFNIKKAGSNTAKNTDSVWAKNLSRAGVWTSEKPIAGDIGSSIEMPLMVRGNRKKYTSLEAMESHISRTGGPAKYRTKMKALGFDGAIVQDEEFNTISHVVFDPKNIRSRFAAFDPKNKNSANLLGNATPEMLGVVAAGSAAGVGYAAHEKKPKNALRKP